MNAATITRQSKSNLALAFVSLGRERKRDITIFYAFCRVVDDIADSAELSVSEKRERLANWRQMLRAGAPDEPLLARDVRQLMAQIFASTRHAGGNHCRSGNGFEHRCDIPLSKSFVSIVTGSPAQLGWSASRFLVIATRAAGNTQSSSDLRCK